LRQIDITDVLIPDGIEIKAFRAHNFINGKLNIFKFLNIQKKGWPEPAKYGKILGVEMQANPKQVTFSIRGPVTKNPSCRRNKTHENFGPVG